MDIKQYFKIKKKQIDIDLKCCLPKSESNSKILWDAMNYSLQSDGERIRPILMYAIYDSLISKNNKLIKNELSATACAIEIVYTSSLILDDLTSRNEDKSSRQKITNHLVYGQSISLLAADALLTYAYELLSRSIPGKTGILLISQLSKLVGTQGMFGGQVVDLISRNKKIDLNTLIYIHRHKTGMLFEYAARAGAILKNNGEKQIKSISRFAAELGLTYQIADDLQKYYASNQGHNYYENKINFVDIIGEKKTLNILHKQILSLNRELGNFKYTGTLLTGMLEYLKLQANPYKQ